MFIELHNKGRVRLKIREDCYDEQIVKAVIEREVYENLNPQSNDVVLDAGGHIGSFAIWVSSKAKEVYSYEPDVTNFGLLKRNLSLNKISNVFPHQMAIIGNETPIIGGETPRTRLYLNRMQNKATHSLLIKRGRDEALVRCENINKILREHGITIAKLDVEGAELEILKAITPARYKRLRTIIFEYHFQQLRDKDHQLYFGLIKHLRQHFKKIIYLRRPSKHFTTIVTCHK